MTEDPETVVRQAYSAFNRRDTAAALGVMDPGVVWPDAVRGGFVTGHQAVRSHWDEVFEATDISIEPLHVRTLDDGKIEATVRQVSRSTDGARADTDRLVHLFTLRDNRIVRMDIAETEEAR
jgi:ketosteroid isomerase-like protein